MEAVEPAREPTLLERIRNMWEFANLAQYIFTFGRAVKIDENLDIEDLEMEFLKSHSTVLPEIGLALLKFVSSHRGLTPEIFDEYTRRQYVAKAPSRNPYGEEEEPAAFKDFDVYTKIRVLQQLTQWTMGNPDRIREKMEEQKDTEQTSWRIEPFGWDAEDRTYIVLDDNRLYRQTDPPPPPPPAAKPKKNSKKGKAARRASKRRKVSETVESEAEPMEEGDTTEIHAEEPEDDGFGGMKWECLAVTLDEYTTFITSLEKSKDPNEKILRKRIVDGVLPLLEKQEEARKRKQAQKERELLNIEKLAHAKRSSRIAGKMEQHKQEEEAREAERKKHTELAMARKEQEKWLKLEKERESRMMTREQRLKEREARRILHEEELANLSEDSKKIEAGQGRLSERHLKAEIERKKQALEELAEEEDWIFDCICGAYGQIDDGTHSIACEKCNVWQHSKCVGVSQKEADREDFEFICKTCERRAKDAERAKTHPPIKIKINRPGSSSSSVAPPILPPKPGSPSVVFRVNSNGNSPVQASPQKVSQNGQSYQGYKPILPPSYGQPSPISYSQQRPGEGSSAPKTDYTGPYGSHQSNGGPAVSPYGAPPIQSSHIFSSPHPQSPTSLPPPKQPQMHTFVNGSIGGTSKPVGQTTPIQKPAGLPQMHNFPAVAIPHGYTPGQSHNNGSRPPSSGNDQRRSSMHMPSPLSSAPVLTPIQKSYHSPNPAPLSSPAFHPTPNLQPRSSPPLAPVTAQVRPQHEVTHSSALPSTITGLSPTKHSPPRPTSNGSFTAGTPSMLPPVSLSPSPQHQNLTPPVKPSEPDRSRINGQTVVP